MALLTEILANILFFASIGAACEIGWQIIRRIRAWRIGKRLAWSRRYPVRPEPRRKSVVYGDKEVMENDKSNSYL